MPHRGVAGSIIAYLTLKCHSGVNGLIVLFK